MDYISWINKRSPSFILKRGLSLLEHYGLGPQKAIHSIDILMDCFKQFDCAPTFSVPGRVIEKNSSYIRSLQDRGAEIAVHGYNHIDLKTCDPVDASAQLMQAVSVFNNYGLDAHGFRCPYLSCTDALMKALPVGVFSYSSNKAVRWDFERSETGKYDPVLYKTINCFYMAEEAKHMSSLPWFHYGMVEIPVTIPDDLQFKDGLGYDQKDIELAWGYLLEQTHAKAEIFNLMFHPELASYCLHPFSAILLAARTYEPKVWVARLWDIAQWWIEKSSLSVEINILSDGSLNLTLPVSSRAHWVARGMNLPDSTRWIGKYMTLSGKSYQFPANIRPFIGVDNSISTSIIDKLVNHGYILDQTESAKYCSIFLDRLSLLDYPTEAALINMIENLDRPLIRLWPWPDGYCSALCITGDLDALSLLDYLNRMNSNHS
jgi:hypothetical protein